MKAPKKFIQIPVKIAKRHDINSTDKLIYGEIHTLLNVVDNFYVSSGSLGKDIGMNRRSAIRSLNHLKVRKLIATNTVHDTKFKHDIRRYIYDLNSADKHSDKGVTKNSDRDVTKGSDKGVTKNSDRDVTQKDNTRRLNKRVTEKITYKKKIIKDLEAMMVAINTFVSQDIDDWLDTYNPKLILKALHMVGTRNPNPRYVITDVTTLLQNGCQIHQPRRHSGTYQSYGRPVIHQKLPKWARDDYHPKLHPTDPKLLKRVREHLKELNAMDKRNK